MKISYNTTNFPNILKLADGQGTLAWLLAQGDDITPIPGTRKVKACSLHFIRLQTNHLVAVFAREQQRAGNEDKRAVLEPQSIDAAPRW
ncbi:hypothetical protein DFH07DRAFT_958704 [Mycena maculata]|uniref:Uncharacterized protein n=1 Tax=Mycena maculata TaxID=230809 RepID=A0AAD7J6R0_9AGAR|nr:hypothetical protein DFH07DRAFT_958704 [Mycena maculata]